MAISPLAPAVPAPMAPVAAPLPAAVEPSLSVTPTASAASQDAADNATSEQSRQGAQQSVESAIEEINRGLQAWATNLRFEIDPEAQRLVVSIIDSETGDVLRTVPSEAVIRVAKMVASLQGNIVSTTA